ncbi:hypothetical protein DFH08DRAFT_953430 [Mycena albidolilacea]|uniref:Uncharacterized protein n=1 Tax=Mycena albidolilacea TaxID=1033008 RepID=A0AAD7AGN3_9AGAR|nr:hypothetical protein DFH08DRAFT_953430 [Mycena albidolilacea]
MQQRAGVTACAARPPARAASLPFHHTELVELVQRRHPHPYRPKSCGGSRLRIAPPHRVGCDVRHLPFVSSSLLSPLAPPAHPRALHPKRSRDVSAAPLPFSILTRIRQGASSSSPTSTDRELRGVAASGSSHHRTARHGSRTRFPAIPVPLFPIRDFVGLRRRHECDRGGGEERLWGETE